MSEAPPRLSKALSQPADLLNLSQGKAADGAEEASWAAEAAQREPVGWHYIQVLAERTRSQTGPAQALLQAKLSTAVAQLQARLAAPQSPNTLPSSSTATRSSPLSALLQDMAAPSAERPSGTSGHGRMDNPRVAQFRQQLGKINVQKQVTQAIAQAPQNAGPINSHMLVLRSLGLMRDLSPDYLNRFVGYVDTLLVLEDSGQGKSDVKKSKAASKLPSQ